MDYVSLLEKYPVGSEETYNFNKLNFIVGINGAGKTRIFKHLLNQDHTLYINGFDERINMVSTHTKSRGFIDPNTLYTIFDKNRAKFGDQPHYGVQYGLEFTEQEEVINKYIIELEGQNKAKGEITQTDFTRLFLTTFSEWELVDICRAAQHDNLIMGINSSHQEGKYREILVQIDEKIDSTLGLESNLLELTKINSEDIVVDYNNGTIQVNSLVTKELIFYRNNQDTGEKDTIRYQELSDGQKITINVIKKMIIWKTYYHIENVILDEIEIGLHPTLLIQIFGSVFELFGSEVRCFIITHNPQIISLLGRKEREQQNFYYVEDFNLTISDRESVLEKILSGSYIEWDTMIDKRILIVEGKDDFQFYKTLLDMNVLNGDKVYFPFGTLRIDGVFPRFSSGLLKKWTKDFTNIGFTNHRMIIDNDGGQNFMNDRNEDNILVYVNRYSLENIIYDPRIMIDYIEKQGNSDIFDKLHPLDEQERIDFILKEYGLYTGDDVQVKYKDGKIFTLKTTFLNKKIKDNIIDFLQIHGFENNIGNYLKKVKDSLSAHLPKDFEEFISLIEN